ncbi:50S ribosomal protein L10, partial [Candidatus Uhrbacteria bacterium]|nr:50S ribosomal protein L10 [Candidatus Uhrbacteria bacterium]
MPLNKQEKQQIVTELVEKLGKSKSAVFADF